MAILSKKKSGFFDNGGMSRSVDRRCRSHRPRSGASNLDERILAAAAIFFAQRGFEAETSDLADQVGITALQLDRRFPDKGELICRVYEEVFLGRWNLEWENLIADHNIPLAARVSEFYHEYAQAVTSYESVRLFVLAWIHKIEFNARYLSFLKVRLFRRLIKEARREYLQKMSDTKPISKREMEVIEHLHTKILLRGMKRHVFNSVLEGDSEDTLEKDIACFLNRMEAVQLERTMRDSRGHAKS
jgi:AcrR family transcriptional regulator